MKKLALIALAFVCGALVTMALEACTPGDRAAFVEAAPALERVTCVFIRALTTDGTALDVCATADELAPLVPELLAERETHPASEPAAPIVAFSITPPRRRVPRRRCAVWQEVPSAEGGADARRD